MNPALNVKNLKRQFYSSIIPLWLSFVCNVRVEFVFNTIRTTRCGIIRRNCMNFRRYGNVPSNLLNMVRDRGRFWLSSPEYRHPRALQIRDRYGSGWGPFRFQRNSMDWCEYDLISLLFCISNNTESSN